MEGKCALFKAFGGLTRSRSCLTPSDPDEIVETLVRLRPTFGAVNLEDISAPRCFEIERRLIEALDCPVMHDDQHGTAIVVLAATDGRDQGARPRHGLAARGDLRRRRGGHGVREHPSGRGHFGYRPCWTPAASCIPRRDGLTPVKARAGGAHQPRRPLRRNGGGAQRRRHVPRRLRRHRPRRADRDDGSRRHRVRAVELPTRRSTPDVAARHAAVVATGRSDFPNQINNVLAFPGVFRGALDAGARRITEKMKVAAAEAIFSVVGDDLAPDRIVPSPLDPRVGPAVAAAVAAAAADDLIGPMRVCRAAAQPAWVGWRHILSRWSSSAAGATQARRSIAVGSTSDPESTVGGAPVCGGAAVLRQPRTCAVRAGSGEPSWTRGRFESCPGSPAGCCRGSSPTPPRARTRRCTAHDGVRRCPKASRQATTRHPAEDVPRDRGEPSGPPTRGVAAT